MSGIAIQTKSNVLTISDPDGFEPDFDVTNLAYFNLYGMNDFTKNIANPNLPATVVGNLALAADGETVRMSTDGNYLQTQVADSASITIIGVAGKPSSVAGDTSIIASCYNGSTSAALVGKTLNLFLRSSDTTQRAAFYWTETLNSSGALSADSMSIATPFDNPYFIFGRTNAATGVVTLKNMTTGETNSKTIVNTYTLGVGTSKYNIGDAPGATGNSQTDMRAVMIYNRALTDAEISVIYSYLQSYYAAKGITI